MKALSLWQPWAELLAHGIKRVETRSWVTPHRGDVLIHSARKDDEEVRESIRTPFFKEQIARLPQPTLHFGDLLGIAYLGYVVPTTRIIVGQNFDKPPYFVDGDASKLLVITRTERQFGDYSERRYAWVFSNFRPFKTPIHYPGARHLFEVHEVNFQREIDAQAADNR